MTSTMVYMIYKVRNHKANTKTVRLFSKIENAIITRKRLNENIKEKEKEKWVMAHNKIRIE